MIHINVRNGAMLNYNNINELFRGEMFIKILRHELLIYLIKFTN